MLGHKEGWVRTLSSEYLGVRLMWLLNLSFLIFEKKLIPTLVVKVVVGMKWAWSLAW